MIVAERVIPRSRASAITGMRGDVLLVRLHAPPVDGAANDALIELLAQAFDRPRREVSLVSGSTSPDKGMAIDGLSQTDFSARLSAILNRVAST